jgi:crotonobetainyl-CoA:carnitine CoA-transferase CaiB-like acyl-CoA transferase
MLLGDMGADVIKIEGPKEGDPVRKAGAIVNDLSWYFASFNRNKRSMALDLRWVNVSDAMSDAHLLSHITKVGPCG